MENFQFQNTTKIIFGKGQIAQLATELPQGKKIMITMGGGSVKANGVYDQVIKALEGFEVVEFWGIEPNPRVETLRKAIELGKREEVEYIVAVGGGSVVDGSKLVAAAILSEDDAWDIVIGRGTFDKVLPLATVITLPATGSEMNRGAVISNSATNEKFVFYSEFPRFSILDPTTTFTLPPYQVACGITDTFIHTMEQYITRCDVSPLMDRWSEGLLSTLIELAPRIKADQTDYEAMSNYMLSATMALNGFTAMGVPQDWATHMIGHEITALTGLTHGNTLAIILPALLRVMREQKWDKLLQYGQRVWGICDGEESERVEQAIEATESFFRSLGLKTRLSECEIGREVIDEVVTRIKARGAAFGENANITYDIVERILSECEY